MSTEANVEMQTMLDTLSEHHRWKMQSWKRTDNGLILVQTQDNKQYAYLEYDVERMYKAALNKIRSQQCAWKGWDSYCHCTQCERHARLFEPDEYVTDDDCEIISGHPCKFSDTCGFELERSELKPATAEQVRDYTEQKRRENIRAQLHAICSHLETLEKLI